MILYINNFRGFKNTFIPIKDVNFLVGENSTGKTSVLKLIKLLSTYEFWEYQRFRTEWFSFESFDEICSDENGKSFEIGFFLHPISPETKPGGWAIHLKFIKNSEGFPRVETIRWMADGIDVEISEIQWEKVIKAKFRYGVQENLNGDFDLKTWVTKNSLRKIKFEDYAITILGENKSMFKITDDIRQQALSSLIKNGKIKSKGIYHSIQQLLAILDNVIWSAPIRSEPLPVYSGVSSFNPNGSYAPFILRDILSDFTVRSRNTEAMLQSFGELSGLFDKIQIKNLDTRSFILEIILDNKSINITNVGYGISQVLPILVELISSNLGSWFSLQQPEIHLHPKGQAALGEFFYGNWVYSRQKFFIETHSDYMVDRFRITMSKNKKNHKKHEDKCQVLFFKRGKNGNEVYPIEIQTDGKYAEGKPKEFGDFFVREEMDLFSLNFD